MAANFADGTVNPIYQNLNQPAIRPVAGNGRVAGLQRAYSQGNAAQYQADLSQDTSHGISPEVISQNPRSCFGQDHAQICGASQHW
jgi:hypothetical protein